MQKMYKISPKFIKISFTLEKKYTEISFNYFKAILIAPRASGQKWIGNQSDSRVTFCSDLTFLIHLPVVALKWLGIASAGIFEKVNKTNDLLHSFKPSTFLGQAAEFNFKSKFELSIFWGL